MEKKITKKQMFEMIKGVVSDNTEMVEFLNHEIELLNKKNSSKTPSRTQIENEGTLKVIVNILTNKENGLTITELQAFEELKNFSNQKISSLMKKLVDNHTVERIKEGKKTIFKLV